VAELAVLIQQSSTYTQEEVVANMGGDWYIDAQEALNHRLVSKIVKSVDEL
jgi:ATP-dependent protease ClpP protease subunit